MRFKPGHRKGKRVSYADHEELLMFKKEIDTILNKLDSMSTGLERMNHKSYWNIEDRSRLYQYELRLKMLFTDFLKRSNNETNQA